MSKHPIRDVLAYQGYNLRERANAYAGMALGALAPIVAVRYMIPTPSEMSAGQEALAWGLSVGTNVVMSIASGGFPLLYTTGVGTVLGSFGACSLRQKRYDKERAEDLKKQKHSLENRAVGDN